jgi:glycosyltransferase involved in cell wall biosynthesis
MTILVLAPHPLYQERGTPIAAGLLLRALAERGERVDVLTYHEGAPLSYAGVRILRIPALPFTRGVRPGFSMKKLACDVALLIRAIGLCARTRYDVLHCIEESVFIGRLLKSLFGVPYLYDMDSSLGEQLLDRSPWLRPLAGWFHACERWAVRGAEVIVPVCDALAESIRRHGPKRVEVLRDISLLQEPAPAGAPAGPSARELTVLYAGNLEPYQGIELLLEAFARAAARGPESRLVIVGGAAGHLAHYGDRARALGLASRVQFLGPQPVAALGSLLHQADVLVSPRIAGRNTPMKIYSYLDAGRAILATDLPTHTQVLTREVALLVEPTPDAFGQGLAQLLGDAPRRARLGEAAGRLAAMRHRYPVFRAAVDRIYAALAPAAGAPA